MKKRLSFIVASVLLFVSIMHGSPQAYAYTVGDTLNTSFDIGNLIEDTLNYVENLLGVTQMTTNDLKQWAVQQAVNAAKKAAISMVQKKLLGSSKSKMITNYGSYLYTAPMQKTNNQMNVYFNTTLGGTGSSMNYEGVGGGNSYSAYLRTQAQGSIKGVNVQLSINNVVSDPTQPFSSGNMQGMMSFLECGNNPYCVSIAAQSKSNQLFDQNQTIAKAEQQNGYLPTKVNGVITSPASMAANLATTASQMGANAIINAINNDTSAVGIINAGVDYVTQLTDQVGAASSDGNSSDTFGVSGND